MQQLIIKLKSHVIDEKLKRLRQIQTKMEKLESESAQLRKDLEPATKRALGNKAHSASIVQGHFHILRMMHRTKTREVFDVRVK